MKQDAAGFHHPVPLLDARRTIRLTRAHAVEWGIDPTKVGVMGSSAGGHVGSRRRLLGDAPSEALMKRVATQLRVNKGTPPCFLIHAADDGAVPLRDSLEFAAR